MACAEDAIAIYVDHDDQKIRDPWANRKLAICARSFSTLPRPAKQLVERLRKAAQ